MLTKSTVQIALEAAKILAHTGHYISIKEGSPFQAVRRSGLQPQYRSDNANYATLVKEYHQNADEHKVAQSNVVQTIKGSLSETMGFVQSVVIPEIKAYASTVTEDFSAIRLHSAVSEFSIQKQSLPAPIRNSYELLAISSHVNVVQGIDSHGSFNLHMDANDIHKFIRTGHADTDDSIASWYMESINDGLLNTWDRVFNGRINDDILSHVASTQGRLDSINHDLLIYLGAMALARTTDDRASGMDAGDYDRTTKLLKRYAGARINKGIAFYEQAIKTGRVVSSVDTQAKTITVLSAPYDEYLIKGGTVSAMLGRALDMEGPLKIQPLLKNTLSLTAKWDTYATMSKARLDKERLKAFKLLATNVYKNTLKNATPVGMEQQYYGGDTIPPESLRKMGERATNIINTLQVEDIDNFIAKAGDIVTQSRYSYTPASQLLSTMEKYHQANNDIQPHEAYLLSAIDYLGEYLADQVVTNKLN